ncbi:MAG: hypothetical protein AAF802_01860 [Planctomycetota bacterium]
MVGRRRCCCGCPGAVVSIASTPYTSSQDFSPSVQFTVPFTTDVTITILGYTFAFTATDKVRCASSLLTQDLVIDDDPQATNIAAIRILDGVIEIGQSRSNVPVYTTEEGFRAEYEWYPIYNLTTGPGTITIDGTDIESYIWSQINQADCPDGTCPQIDSPTHLLWRLSGVPIQGYSGVDKVRHVGCVTHIDGNEPEIDTYEIEHKVATYTLDVEYGGDDVIYQPSNNEVNGRPGTHASVSGIPPNKIQQPGCDWPDVNVGTFTGFATYLTWRTQFESIPPGFMDDPDSGNTCNPIEDERFLICLDESQYLGAGQQVQNHGYQWNLREAVIVGPNVAVNFKHRVDMTISFERSGSNWLVDVDATIRYWGHDDQEGTEQFGHPVIGVGDGIYVNVVSEEVISVTPTIDRPDDPTPETQTDTWATPFVYEAVDLSSIVIFNTCQQPFFDLPGSWPTVSVPWHTDFTVQVLVGHGTIFDADGDVCEWDNTDVPNVYIPGAEYDRILDKLSADWIEGGEERHYDYSIGVWKTVSAHWQFTLSSLTNPALTSLVLDDTNVVTDPDLHFLTNYTVGKESDTEETNVSGAIGDGPIEFIFTTITQTIGNLFYTRVIQTRKASELGFIVVPRP